ncbi:MAG: SDR family NAD(P)-dependent oxidoreductase, partial [Halomonadaceae bacterium]
GRLTDEAATERFAASVDEAGDNAISRANVALALVHAVGQPTLANAEFTLLDGKRRVAEVMA